MSAEATELVLFVDNDAPLYKQKATSPASIRPMNNTIGGTGFLMHQDEILRKPMNLSS